MKNLKYLMIYQPAFIAFAEVLATLPSHMSVADAKSVKIAPFRLVAWAASHNLDILPTNHPPWIILDIFMQF